MTRERARELNPIYQAYMDGKIVQWKMKDESSMAWRDDLDLVQFGSESLSYRIKPQPKMRAWKYTEVPIGALIDLWTRDQSKPSVILGVEGNGLTVATSSSITTYSFEECFRDGKCSIDPVGTPPEKRTWIACGVEDTQP